MIDAGTARQTWRSHHQTRRLVTLANNIATMLESRGVNACPGDCFEGTCCVVIFHGNAPDRDARHLIDNGDGLVEKLLYEGRQILHARQCLRDMDDSDDARAALAQFRTAQDRDTWL
jgi:hypothetical protein